jgi:hypothetical protein
MKNKISKLEIDSEAFNSVADRISLLYLGFNYKKLENKAFNESKKINVSMT